MSKEPLQVRAAMLHAPPVGVEVDVSQRLRRAESAEDQRLSVGVDHVHKLGIPFVETCAGVLELEQWARWI